MNDFAAGKHLFDSLLGTTVKFRTWDREQLRFTDELQEGRVYGVYTTNNGTMLEILTPTGVIESVLARFCVIPTATAKEKSLLRLGGYDDWIDWEGGLCPVPADTLVQVVFRREADGKSVWNDGCGSAENWRWDHDGDGYDTVAYRIVKETT